MTLTPELERQRRADLFEFKASFYCTANSKLAKLNSKTLPQRGKKIKRIGKMAQKLTKITIQS